MKERIVEIIKEVLANNEFQKNGRDYALLGEVKSILNNNLRDALNELYKTGEIEIGNTLNDKWIKLK